MMIPPPPDSKKKVRCRWQIEIQIDRMNGEINITQEAINNLGAPIGEVAGTKMK